MANYKQITGQYIEFIAKEVINKFGASYQNYPNMGKLWRQKYPYYAEIDAFLIERTNLFLRLLDVRDQGNFNMMYKVCYNIAEHLSKYLVKKSPDLTRENVTDEVLNDIFLESDRFVAKFKKSYKKPLDMNNTQYIVCNPGVVAMYNAIHNKAY